MALPTRPTPTRINGDYIFMYAKGTGDADYVLLAQISEATGGQEEGMDEWRTIGSGPQRASEDTQYPVSLVVQVPTNITEAAQLIGVHEPGAGPYAWAGTESLVINPTIAIDYKREYYTSGGTLLYTKYWDDVKWEKKENKYSAAGYLMWTLNGLAVDAYITPPVG